MEYNYEREFQLSRFVAVVQTVGTLIILIVSELILAGVIPVPGEAILPAAELQLVRIVFTVVALLMLILAWTMKRTIRRPAPGPMLGLLCFLTRQQHRRRRASAVALLIPPSALCEGAAVLGFALFLIGGHERLDLYPPVLAGLCLLLLLFPTPEERDNLISLDRETE